MARVTQKHNLEVINPSLAKQWHPTKNGTLTPKAVTPMSGRKVWWICSKGHRWEAYIFSRNKGSRCPYCSAQLATKEHNLQIINPHLANQWHPAKNGVLTPTDVTPVSGKEVWWICDKGHEWEAAISDRTNGGGCPYCSGRRVCEDNCLQTVNPGLAKEWHPSKNGSLTPRDVVSHSTKRVWWICNRGHEWEAVVSNRSNGTGCPYCARERRFNGQKT